MRVIDRTWMQIEEYLQRDNRIIVPLGSIEQHAYLSLGVDMILSERISVDAADPLGVAVMPSLPYGLTPYFAAFPGSPTLQVETYRSVLDDLLNSFYDQGFRRVLFVNGHGGNDPGRPAVEAWNAAHPDAQALWHNWWSGTRTRAVIDEIDVEASHGSWMENFPWTRLPEIEQPQGHKAAVDTSSMLDLNPVEVRRLLGDGQFGGYYERPDEDVLRVWEAGVAETRALIERGWRDA